MANYELANDSIDTIPIMGKDAASDAVPLPAGTTPTVINGDPVSLNAVIDGTNLVLNALVPLASNISVEIDDGTLTPFKFVVDIVEDVTPTSVTLDLTHVTHASQPVPVAATPAPTPTPTPSATPGP